MTYPSHTSLLDTVETSREGLSPQRAALWIGWAFGLVFALLIPPFQALTNMRTFIEASTFRRAISGRCAGKELGGYLPISLVKTAEGVSQDIPFHPDKKQDVRRVWQCLRLPMRAEDRMFVSYSSVAWYSPLMYLPQSAGIGLGRMIGLSPLGTLYLGRLANLLAWSVCVYWAIRLIPLMKWTLMLLAVMPMSLAQAASLSADATTNALAFLCFAAMLRLAMNESEPKLRTSSLAWMLPLGMAMSLVKPAYTPLLLLLALTPAKRFGSRWRWTATLLVFWSLCLLPGIAWWLSGNGLNDSYQAEGVNAKAQAAYMLGHPLESILRNFGALSMAFICSIVGKLGWFDTRLSRGFVFAYYGVLIAVTVLHGRRGPRIAGWQKLLIGGAAVLAWLSVFTLVYLTFTKVGNHNISGLQGRYMVPIMPLAMAMFHIPGVVKEDAWRPRPWMMTLWSVGSCLYIVYAIITRYYLV